MPSKEASRANLAKARAAKLEKLKKENELSKYFIDDIKVPSLEDTIINEIKNLKEEIIRLKPLINQENPVPLKPPFSKEEKDREKQKKSLSRAEIIKRSLLNF
jgi:hypothetical protein